MMYLGSERLAVKVFTGGSREKGHILLSAAPAPAKPFTMKT